MSSMVLHHAPFLPLFHHSKKLQEELSMVAGGISQHGQTTAFRDSYIKGFKCFCFLFLF